MPGIMMNCAHAPSSISSGRRARMRKSLVVRVRPIVSMMSPRMMVCVVPRTQLKAAGRKNVMTAIAMMNGEA